MCRPWPIGQLRPPDTPGPIKKAKDNGITGQINDPLMKSPTKQAKTARPTYVFHHAVALTFPVALPPRQAQLGTARLTERLAKWEKNDSVLWHRKAPHPRPLWDFWTNKSICCHTVPLSPPSLCCRGPREQHRPQLSLLTLGHSPLLPLAPSSSIHLCVLHKRTDTRADKLRES